MESLELRIFKEVARTKSISKAALNLGYVQSNITAHIKKLENELHTPLFIRHNKGVTLTNKGEELCVYAEKIITLLDEATKSTTIVQTSLTIGTTQTIAGFFLPQYLAVYQKQNPHIRISIKILSHEEMEKGLLSNEIDCIITNANILFTHAKMLFQYPEKLYILTPKACKRIDDMYTYPLIVNTISSCPYRKLLIDYVQSKNITSPTICEFDSVEAILHAVAFGMGISLLPKRVIKNNHAVNTFYEQSLQNTVIKFYTLDGHVPEKLKTLFAYIEHTMHTIIE